MRGRCTKCGREKGAGGEGIWCTGTRKPTECVGGAPNADGKKAPAGKEFGALEPATPLNAWAVHQMRTG
ncbi:MAG: hypothetical protein UEB92_04755, partial [Clostridia bacterium]|nr:hypothetical protein [Clostridia bacterium]